MEKIKKVGEEEKKKKKNREGRSWKKKRRLVMRECFWRGFIKQPEEFFRVIMDGRNQRAALRSNNGRDDSVGREGWDEAEREHISLM